VEQLITAGQSNVVKKTKVQVSALRTGKVLVKCTLGQQIPILHRRNPFANNGEIHNVFWDTLTAFQGI
jgi:hypothetical protein